MNPGVLTSPVTSQSEALARAVRTHSIGWLLAANAVGLLLAALLLWPDLGDAFGPFGYGRWVPLHLNWQLYGWCSLPVVGVLLGACIEQRHPHAEVHARVALVAWSIALFLGGASWLGGVNSGKLFLEWSGWARPLIAIAMAVLWTVLAAHVYWRCLHVSVRTIWIQISLLVLLLPVPALLYWSEGREVYPSVNPDSGGATGASLLGSTLGIITIFGMLPELLGLRRHPVNGRLIKPVFWTAWAVSWGIFMVIDHGHVSHHAIGQIAGLGTLLAWVPLLWTYTRTWAWSGGARPWLLAAGVWWALLIISGWISFLPGVAEKWKFTHTLVAHAHLAMAGMVTSANFAILNELDPLRPLRAGLKLWQTGCALHIGILMALGLSESEQSADLFYGAAWTQWVFAGRLAAGGLMFTATVLAWREARKITRS